VQAGSTSVDEAVDQIIKYLVAKEIVPPF